MNIKIEKREYYDSYGTGNFTENKNNRCIMELNPEQANIFLNTWKSTASACYETSTAKCFEFYTDARHYDLIRVFK